MSSRGFQPSTVIVYLDTNDPQTFSGSLSGVDSQKKKLYKQNRVIFCDYLPSPSRIQCSTFVAYIPISACHSLLLLTLTLGSSATATIRPPSKKGPSSCCLLRLYLLLTKASDRTITEPYYQTFHTHIAPINTFFVLGLWHPSSSLSVRLFFLHVMRQAYHFFLSENHMS